MGKFISQQAFDALTLEERINLGVPYVFVAQEYNDHLDQVLGGIHAACNSLGDDSINVLSVAHIPGQGSIWEQVQLAIEHSAFGISDMSMSTKGPYTNHNVAVETGMMIAQKKPVLYLSTDVAASIARHTDLRDQRWIQYSLGNIDGLISDLQLNIHATLRTHSPTNELAQRPAVVAEEQDDKKISFLQYANLVLTADQRAENYAIRKTLYPWEISGQDGKYVCFDSTSFQIPNPKVLFRNEIDHAKWRVFDFNSGTYKEITNHKLADVERIKLSHCGNYISYIFGKDVSNSVQWFAQSISLKDNKQSSEIFIGEDQKKEKSDIAKFGNRSIDRYHALGVWNDLLYSQTIDGIIFSTFSGEHVQFHDTGDLVIVYHSDDQGMYILHGDHNDIQIEELSGSIYQTRTVLKFPNDDNVRRWGHWKYSGGRFSVHQVRDSRVSQRDFKTYPSMVDFGSKNSEAYFTDFQNFDGWELFAVSTNGELVYGKAMHGHKGTEDNFPYKLFYHNIGSRELTMIPGLELEYADRGQFSQNCEELTVLSRRDGILKYEVVHK